MAFLPLFNTNGKKQSPLGKGRKRSLASVACHSCLLTPKKKQSVRNSGTARDDSWQATYKTGNRREHHCCRLP